MMVFRLLRNTLYCCQGSWRPEEEWGFFALEVYPVGK